MANTLLCPKNKTLDKHQIQGAYYIRDTQGNIFLCDDMGKGKTVTSIAFMNLEKITKVLIVAKAKGGEVWKSHLRDWHILKPKISIYHPDATFFHTDILIVNYHWLSYKECAREIKEHFYYTHIFLDEIHTIRKGSAQRGRFLFSKNGICNRAKKVVALTGTPLFNKVMGMYPMLKGLRPDIIDDMNRHKFGMKYCGGFMDRDCTWNYNGASNVGLLKKKLEATCMLRRLTQEKELPPLDPPVIKYLKNTKEAVKLDTLLATVFDKNFTPNTKAFNDSSNEISTQRRIVGEAKVPGVAHHVRDITLNGWYKRSSSKILIFAYHISVIKELHKHLAEMNSSFIVDSLTGQSLPKKVNDVINRFQNLKKRQILIASIGAFGDTITLTAATQLIFAEISYVWKENLQAIKRVHRRGRKKPVRPIFIAQENSFDDLILKINLKKLKTALKFD